MLEKYWNIEGFLGKFLKTKSVLKSTGESLQGLEKSLDLLFSLSQSRFSQLEFYSVNLNFS